MSDLYGLPDESRFDGKAFRRRGIYKTHHQAQQDARRWRADGYNTHIIEVPKNHMGWKYGLYVRRKRL